MEDYCHSFEHTVELQVIFLQHMLGADVKILPILCGSFAHSIYEGGKPEDDDKVRASSTRWANCASARATSCSG